MKKTLFLLTTFLITFAAHADNIKFVDPNVKSVCVDKWDTSGDGELSMEEAAAVTYLGDAFSFNNDIVEFPELQYFTSLTEIDTYAFYRCKSLRTIQLPSQITHISGSAFFNCTSLQEVSIPGTVKKIAEYAFNGCSSLTSLTLEEGVTSIGEYAFCSCKSLTQLHIPSSVTTINASSFWSCSSLTTITVDASNTVYDSREDCNAIVITATNTLLLGTIATVIPSSVTIIGPSSFYGNSKLESILIPEGVHTISGSAFSSCTALTYVSLPTTLTTIGDYAFSGCTRLSSLSLPMGLKKIENYAFKGCDYLEKISIPASVTKIGSYAFSECSYLLKVAVAHTSPLSISSTTFTHRKLATLYVPKGCYSAYKNANYWKEFKTIVELGDNMLTAAVEPEEMVTGQATALTLSLNNDDFYSYRNLQTDITLPDGFFLDDNTITPTDRSTGMTITVEPLEDNVYRLTCASETAAVTGTEGALFTIGLKADTSVPNGDYQGMVTNITLTDDYGMQQTLTDAEFSWSVVAYYMGDVNHSGEVNVSDVVSCVDYILAITTENFHEDRADMNGDGIINISDIVMIVDTILGIISLRY